MKPSGRTWSAFGCGALTATLLLAVPAGAVVVNAAGDAHPHTYDGTTPALTVSPIRFRLGHSINAADPEPPTFDCAFGVWNFVPLQMRWSATDATSGVASYDIWTSGAGAGGVFKAASATSATSFNYEGTNYRGECGGGSQFDQNFWVTARDTRGNLATSNVSASVEGVTVWTEAGRAPYAQSAALPLTKTGAWSVSKCTCDNNGRDLYSTAAGAALSYTVTTTRPAQTVAVVASKNANRGMLNISVDGGTPTAVNTRAATRRNRVIVWQRTLGVGTHTLKLTNAGTAGRSRVDVDSIMLTSEVTAAAPGLQETR
jgi:hypothetical protein